MKRILSLALAVALILVLAVPVLAVPASAADDYNPWIDIAEVCTVNNSGSNYFAFNGSTTVTLSPGFSTIVSQIDMIWYCGYGAPSAVYLWRSSSASSRVRLNVQQIGGSYYRIYGSVANYTMSDYKFDIETGTTSYRSYEIKTCRIAESLATYPVDVAYMFDEYYGASVSEYEGSVSVSSAIDIKYGTSQNWILELYPDGWKGYDYLDVLVSTNAASIGSIVVMHNDRVLPFDVTYLYSDSGSYVNSNDIYSSPLEPDLSVLIHIDVSSVSRTSSIVPEIRIEGWWNSGVGCDIQFSCIGYIAPPDRTGVSYWFSKGTSFLDTLFDRLALRSEEFLARLATRNEEFLRLMADRNEAFLIGLLDPDKVQQPVEELEDSSESISQGVADIGSFEESQQTTLNTGFSTIQSNISFANFNSALGFVQKYVNMTFNGISKYTIVFALPLFLGLFFYLCSRIPGVTRWKPRPRQSKGGDGP